MNIAQTKQIDIVDFLKAIGCFPTRETACAAWFRAPYREDMTPSFKVNKNRNYYVCKLYIRCYIYRLLNW